MNYSREYEKKVEDRETPLAYEGRKLFWEKIGACLSIFRWGLTDAESHFMANRNAFRSTIAKLKDYAESEDKMRYVVEYHADGGQMCVPGRRVFKIESRAQAFEKKMMNEKGHTCKNSVKLIATLKFVEDEGDMYPDVAGSGEDEEN